MSLVARNPDCAALHPGYGLAMAGEAGRRVRIRGRVQGVWYRGWTVALAERLGLRGWVRNRSDGSVEAVFAGPGDAVEAMIAACRDGPTAARVEAIEVDALADDALAALPGWFEQRDTE